MAAAGDGTLTYLVDLPPEAMPPVRHGDLELVWEAARRAADRADWGAARLFRFRRADGSFTDLALADRDACCWAGAVDGSVGMQTSYGMSVCLRLLALVDLLARARWADRFFTLRRDGAELHPALLRAAATAGLTREARFDAEAMRAELVRDRLIPYAAGGVPHCPGATA